MARNFIIDTDTASDDAVALLMAFRHPDIEVRAVTVVAGNVTVEQGCKNALYTAELCEVNVPIYKGADRPLVRELKIADWFHGVDGMGGKHYQSNYQLAEGHAVDALIHTIKENPGIELVTLGPLTNVAMAIRMAPEIVENVSRCVVMGGAACTMGNVTPAAEYNMWVDPEAARVVFHSGMPVEMVGWELGIGEYAFTEDEIRLLDEVGTPYSQFTLECNLDAMNAFEIQTGQKGMAIHDPTAMAIAIDPSICTEQSSHYVEIETESDLTRGMTVVDKLDNADDARNRDVWQRPVEKNIKTKICWSMDSSRWKDLLYQLLQ